MIIDGLTWIWMFTFWLYGQNVVGQENMGLDSPMTSTQQEQRQLGFQEFREVKPAPAPGPVPVQQSFGNNDNTNNMTPVDLNVCSDTNYRQVDTLPGLRRSTEVRTLQLGQSGVIWPMNNRSIPFNTDCYLQLSACSACLIVISWNPPSTDIRSGPVIDQQDQSIHTSCESVWDFRDRPRCIDLRLIETDADQTTLKPYQRVSLLNAPAEYRGQFVSTSYKLDLNLQFWRGEPDRINSLKQLFPLKYTVIDNTGTIRGRPSPSDLPTNYSDGFIASPRFPKTYPEGVTVNYTFINDDPDGAVRLVFTDFRLHYMSILKVMDSNGQEIVNTQSQYGTSQRPAAIQSNGNTLTVMFMANNYKHDIGFRANYRFVKDKTWLDRPSPKSCNKVFEDTGGTITIENMNLDAFSYVDCIWVLEKARYAPVGFDKLYLKVEDFSVISGGKGIQVDVHVGRTSTNRRLLTIFGPKSSEQLAREQPQEGFISDSVQLAMAEKLATTTMDEDDSDTGFYLRLRGYLGSATGMSIVFAQFYRWATAICHDVSEYHCDNGRCISNRYQCDAHDHCGDFSDEIKCQKHGSRGRGSMTGGGYGDDGPEGSNFSLSGYTTTILLVAGLVGLTLVLLLVTVIVARVYKQKLIRRFTNASSTAASPINDRDDGAGSLSTTSSVQRSSSAILMPMDEQIGTRPGPTLHQVGNRRLLMLPESDIGVLEAPPTYDDALKHPTVPPSAATTLQRVSQPDLPSPSADTPSSASTAGPSIDPVSASFDNPVFNSEDDAVEETWECAGSAGDGGRGGRRASDDSTSSTVSFSGSSADEGSSDSVTASDVENAYGCDVRNGQGPSDPQPPSANADPPTSNGGTRKPPVPLPRTSVIRASSSQAFGGQVSAGEDNAPANEPELSTTLV